MIRFLIKRFIYGILVVFGVITLVFFLFNVLPGDPARMVLGQRADISSVEMINKDLGLDQALHIQYFKYLDDLSPISIYNPADSSSFFYLDSMKYAPFVPLLKFSDHSRLILKAPYLRRSFQSKKDVSEIIGETILNTFVLAGSSILFGAFIGIIAGIFAALWKSSFYDRAALFISALGMSLPSFFSAILAGWIFAFLLRDYTHLELTGNLFEIDDFGNGPFLQLKNLILPAFTLGIRPLAVVLQLTRNSMLEVLSQDYIRTAKSKGLSVYQVIRKHALKNALNPVLTSISGWFASLMAGVVFVEYIFGWKGLGYVIVDALKKYDLPVIMACVLSISIIFVIINILVDIIYGFLDPRVRIK